MAVNTGTPFPINPVLTGISQAYEQPNLIADRVLPRTPVDAAVFKYAQFDKGETFTIPNTRVGRKSPPNEVDVTATEVTAATEDFGLDDPIPQRDLDNARIDIDPLGRATERITQLMMLDRENRVAAAVQASANYLAGTAGQVTLSGTSQWSDQTNSKPINDITDALDKMVRRANIGVIGRLAATGLMRHPDIVRAYHGNAGQSGMVPMKFISDLFGLDDILVGEAFLNSAKEGQTSSLARVWGKHMSLLYIDPNAARNRAPTYGFTAEFGSRVAGDKPDSSIGAFGGVRVRVAESVKEVISGKDFGYLLINVVA